MHTLLQLSVEQQLQLKLLLSASRHQLTFQLIFTLFVSATTPTDMSTAINLYISTVTSTVFSALKTIPGAPTSTEYQLLSSLISSTEISTALISYSLYAGSTAFSADYSNVNSATFLTI